MNLSRLFAYFAPGILISSLLFVQFQYADDSIKTKSGLEINTIAKSNMFPQNWLKAPINAKAYSLSRHLRSTSVKNIESAIAKYPDSVIGSVKQVYLLDGLKFYDKPAWSTHSENNIYIVHPNWQTRNCAWLEDIFHYRAAQILKYKNPNNFEASAWSNCNPAGFEYGKSENSVAKAKDGTITSADPENGFVCQYARTSINADFSMTSSFLFAGKQGLWDMAKRYPRIQQKIDLTIKFYEKLDSSLNKEFFQKLAKKPKKDCC